MANLTDTAFGLVGLLTIAVYGLHVLNGTTPELALAIALGGGLALAVLARIILNIVHDALEVEEEARAREATEAAETEGAAEDEDAPTQPTSAAADDPEPDAEAVATTAVGSMSRRVA